MRSRRSPHKEQAAGEELVLQNRLHADSEPVTRCSQSDKAVDGPVKASSDTDDSVMEVNGSASAAGGGGDPSLNGEGCIAIHQHQRVIQSNTLVLAGQTSATELASSPSKYNGIVPSALPRVGSKDRPSSASSSAASGSVTHLELRRSHRASLAEHGSATRSFGSRNSVWQDEDDDASMPSVEQKRGHTSKTDSGRLGPTEEPDILVTDGDACNHVRGAGRDGTDTEDDVATVKMAPCEDPRAYCGFCCQLDTPTNLVSCYVCGNSGHRVCLQYSEELFAWAQKNPLWTCIECKTCMVCQIQGDDDKLLFCDKCDEAIHMFCLDPPIDAEPEGTFYCPVCLGQSLPAPPHERNKPRKRGRKPRQEPGSTVKGRRQSKGDKRPPKGREAASPVKRKRKLSTSQQRQTGTKRRAKSSTEADEVEVASAVGVEMDDPVLKSVPPAQLQLFESVQKEVSQSLKACEKRTQAKQKIRFGKHEIDAWFQSRYPEEYAVLPVIHICEFCLKFVKSEDRLRRHMQRCEVNQQPPGNEIYRDGNLQIWEVDGQQSKIYCQNLCLLAKLFLDHKTLHSDVEPFLFYVAAERDEYGCHLIGYFSKEKQSIANYNVSCILTMPHMMRRGFGTMLIEFSYLLTRVERTVGTPEKPLSSLGAIAYRRYWDTVVLDQLFKRKGESASVRDICIATGMSPLDVSTTLQRLKVLRMDEHDQPRALIVPVEEASAAAERWARRLVKIDPDKLIWTPLSQRDY